MGILSKFVGGMAQGVADTSMLGMRAEIEKMRDDRLAETRAAEQRRGFTHEEGLIRSREEVRRSGAMYDVQNVDPLKNENALKLAKDTEQARIDITTSPENTQKAIDRLNQMAPAEAKVKREAMIEELQAKATPEALRAARDIARATHIESAGSSATAELAKLSIDEKRRVMKLQDEYLNPNTSDKRKESITTEINVLSGKKEDVIKMRVKVGEDADGRAIMEDVLVDPKTRTRINTSPPVVPSPSDIEGLLVRRNNPAAISVFENKFGLGSAEKYLKPKPNDKPLPGLIERATRPGYGTAMDAINPRRMIPQEESTQMPVP